MADFGSDGEREGERDNSCECASQHALLVLVAERAASLVLARAFFVLGQRQSQTQNNRNKRQKCRVRLLGSD